MDTKTIKILKGVPASFSGYLVPDWQFRQMNADLYEKDMLKQRLEEISQPEESHMARDLLIGFLAGSAAVLAVEKFGH